MRDGRQTVDPGRRDPAGDALREGRLARIKLVATGLLGLCVLLFVISRTLQAAHPALAYVAAFSEAAIIGALADWYAVVVLFRHPMGLKLPHTAIIPANHSRIAENLGEFIETHFLAPEPIAEKLNEVDFAGRTAAWLADPDRSHALADGMARLLPRFLDTVESTGLRDWVARNALARLEEFELAPALADALGTLVAGGRHHDLLHEVLAGLRRMLGDEDTVAAIREKIRNELPTLFQLFQADAYLLKKLLASAHALLEEVERDRQHPLRREFDAFVQDFIGRLRTEPAYRAKADAIKRELLARPALREFALDLWQRAKVWAARDAANEGSLMRGHMRSLLSELGKELAADIELRKRLNREVALALGQLIQGHKRAVSRFISEQVKSWDAEELTRLVELNIGTDLQYIRINGTLVGGLLGLSIYTLAVLAGL